MINIAIEGKITQVGSLNGWKNKGTTLIPILLGVVVITSMYF